MRFSITLVLAVCAPLLALAAPIPVPGDAKVAGGYPGSHTWKRDSSETESFTSGEWKRGDAKVDWSNRNWKKDGSSNAERFPEQGWKRGDAKVNGPPNQEWKA
jgi:hypothetical protein